MQHEIYNKSSDFDVNYAAYVRSKNQSKFRYD